MIQKRTTIVTSAQPFISKCGGRRLARQMRLPWVTLEIDALHDHLAGDDGRARRWHEEQFGASGEDRQSGGGGAPAGPGDPVSPS
jgi:hypothetical protein